MTGSGADQVSLGFLDHLLQVQAVPHVKLMRHATPDIVRDLQTTYWVNETIWDVMVNAGVQMTENAGCAACLGGPVDTFGRINKSGIKCISATNRNFPGRMGHKESQVFLASPVTVAASALTGKITDPRGFLS